MGELYGSSEEAESGRTAVRLQRATSSLLGAFQLVLAGFSQAEVALAFDGNRTSRRCSSSCRRLLR